MWIDPDNPNADRPFREMVSLGTSNISKGDHLGPKSMDRYREVVDMER